VIWDVCHQAGRRKVDPLVSRQASGTHGSYNSRHDCISCIFALQPETGSNLNGAGPDEEESGNTQPINQY
jgi:hypothetical protein